MLDQIKNVIQTKIASELKSRFGLSDTVVNLVIDKVFELISGNSGSGNFQNIINIGSNLLKNTELSSIINNLDSNLPEKLKEIKEIDENKAVEITNFIKPKLQEVLNSGSSGFMDKLGDLF